MPDEIVFIVAGGPEAVSGLSEPSEPPDIIFVEPIGVDIPQGTAVVPLGIPRAAGLLIPFDMKAMIPPGTQFGLQTCVLGIGITRKGVNTAEVLIKNRPMVFPAFKDDTLFSVAQRLGIPVASGPVVIFPEKWLKGER
ncbi:hypothetical protein A2160_05060 [Candidatus Beckwithbacteria bacterium RBG_13_42_9]|uniref:Uncharacterized protein n=1 Tax=Candidatus Beckwithbacteria bacterium RBG_13_42_9 TaxID=1797457 RepID=A0A1F5E6G1_9BACT|nr:MAG: hypothetical protein A2160_05060 [Candidatus Beckwithbacteria bacterium RBG_13_42_9]